MIQEVGYIGKGKYSAMDGSKTTMCYNSWNYMIRRCYDPYVINKGNNLVYQDVFVCDEWHNFQNFAEWYYENIYAIGNEQMHLDKDILVKGNKVYSPETCVFVPQRINKLFTLRNRCRNGLPVGCYLEKSSGKYKAQLTADGKRINLGRYETPRQAFIAYKNEKEKFIKEVANRYKNDIPNKLYVALMEYEIDILD